MFDLQPAAAALARLVEPIASGEGPYGPAVAVPQDASHLHRLLGAAGRDPGWTATR